MKIKLENKIEVEINTHKTQICRKCNRKIYYGRTRSGNILPISWIKGKGFCNHFIYCEKLKSNQLRI